MEHIELTRLISLNAIDQLGPRRIRDLLARFGDASAVFRASESALREVDGISAKIASGIRQGPNPAFEEAQLRRADEMHARIIALGEPGYPACLAAIHDPPVLLHVRGTLLPADVPGVAVVGTRMPTAYGRETARDIATALAGSRITVMSGLARGVDFEAHAGALKAQGRTVAVLGSGLDAEYPRSRSGLLESIAGQGAVVSEFPFGTPQDAPHFPRRNRIISGLSRAVVVVEAADKSGALITSSYALDQGRDVFAVPGAINNPMSAGTNRLIQQGARPITSPADLVASLGGALPAKAARLLPPLDRQEAAVAALLSPSPMHIDEIARQARLPVTGLHPVLLALELKGVVTQRTGMNYVRNA